MKNLVFPKRLGRIAYILRILFLQVLLYALMIGATNHEGMPSQYAYIVILVLSYVYMVVYVCIPRCLDCGLNPWTLLLFFIPVVNLIYGLFLALMKPKEERAREMAYASDS